MYPVLFEVFAPSSREKSASRTDKNVLSEYALTFFFLLLLGWVVQPSARLQTNSFQWTLILARWRLLVGNTQVAIYSMKHQSWPKYTSAAVMTMDPRRSPEEALWVVVGGGRRGTCFLLRDSEHLDYFKTRRRPKKVKCNILVAGGAAAALLMSTRRNSCCHPATELPSALPRAQLKAEPGPARPTPLKTRPHAASKQLTHLKLDSHLPSLTGYYFSCSRGRGRDISFLFFPSSF